MKNSTSKFVSTLLVFICAFLPIFNHAQTVSTQKKIEAAQISLAISLTGDFDYPYLQPEWLVNKNIDSVLFTVTLNKIERRYIKLSVIRQNGKITQMIAKYDPSIIAGDSVQSRYNITYSDSDRRSEMVYGLTDLSQTTVFPNERLDLNYDASGRLTERAWAVLSNGVVRAYEYRYQNSNFDANGNPLNIIYTLNLSPQYRRAEYLYNGTTRTNEKIYSCTQSNFSSCTSLITNTDFVINGNAQLTDEKRISYITPSRCSQTYQRYDANNRLSWIVSDTCRSNTSTSSDGNYFVWNNQNNLDFIGRNIGRIRPAYPNIPNWTTDSVMKAKFYLSVSTPIKEVALLNFDVNTLIKDNPNIEIAGLLDNEKYELTISNLFGVQIFNKKIIGESIVNINFPKVVTGTYILQIRNSKGEIGNKKLVYMN